MNYKQQPCTREDLAVCVIRYEDYEVEDDGTADLLGFISEGDIDPTVRAEYHCHQCTANWPIDNPYDEHQANVAWQVALDHLDEKPEQDAA